MAKYIKFVISLTGCLVICTFLVMFAFTTKYTEPEATEMGNVPPTDVDNNQNTEEKVQGVSTQKSETEKYILRYYPTRDTVMLIAKKADGTEIMSPVESINPYYLTDDDVKALIEGIELTSMEDVYILIEDLSS